MKGFHQPFNKTAKLMVPCKTLAKIYLLYALRKLSHSIPKHNPFFYMILTEATLRDLCLVNHLQKNLLRISNKIFLGHNSNTARLVFCYYFCPFTTPSEQRKSDEEEKENLSKPNFFEIFVIKGPIAWLLKADVGNISPSKSGWLK